MLAWVTSLSYLFLLFWAAGAQADEDSFLDDLQERTFDWFWEFSPPPHGLTLDRAPHEGGFCSVAALGFALTAYPVGVERGWVTRDEGIERTLNTLRFLMEAPQHDGANATTGYRGFFYHFIDPDTGWRFRQVELSTIDTALLMAGVLFCREYYQREHPKEVEIRDLADRLYRRVDWAWMQQPDHLIGHGWKPETGSLQHAYKGYNEAMLLYLLALGSPTHPIRQEGWHAFEASCVYDAFESFEFIQFTPLFGHQYSHVWVDFKGIQDVLMQTYAMDWFENSRRATLSQRAYAIRNPMGWEGYGPNIWGLTACDGPVNGEWVIKGNKRRLWTYAARGASSIRTRDDGTIAPTAAGGSLPFAPTEVMAALQAMQDEYGADIYTRYGYIDAFNPSLKEAPKPLQHGHIVPDKGWFDDEHLGIDQGPILLMAENHRTGLIWRFMRRSPYLRRGLERAGFKGGWLSEAQQQ